MIKNSPICTLAQNLSQVANFAPSNSELVLIEANHFFAHHCNLPAIVRALERRGNFRYAPYIPMDAWEVNNETLKLVLEFYEAIGIKGDVVKATPSASHVNRAKETVTSNFEFFTGSIWGLSDFHLTDIPLGVHLVEILCQQLRGTNFEQSIDTVAYCIKMLAKFFWWESYFESNKVHCVLASHNCYEFALPQLAGIQAGVKAYTWHDNYLFDSSYSLPLPLDNSRFFNQHRVLFERLPSDEVELITSISEDELRQRANGLRVGSLRNDPRFQISGRGRAFVNRTKRKSIVVYVHAFTDAPNTLPEGSFGYLSNPFVATRRLFEILSSLRNEYDIFVKSHPNPFPQDAVAIDGLLNDFSFIQKLDPRLVVADLKDLGVSLILTGWGSVAYEGPIIGVKTAAYSRFVPFSFDFGLPVIDLASADLASKVIKDLVEGPAAKIDYRNLVKAYAIVSRYSNLNLTSSLLPSLPREGDKGRYSPYAYRYWYETFDASLFEANVDRLMSFFQSEDVAPQLLHEETPSLR